MKKLVIAGAIGALIAASMGCGSKEEGDLSAPKTDATTTPPAEKPTDDKAAADPTASKPTDDKGTTTPDKPTDDKAAAGK